jgi:DNA-binding NarL/FixJ family response regulator
MIDEAEQSPRNAISVLICDDNEMMRALLRVVVELRPTLRVAGEAADGHYAIREAAELQPDVILLDLAMPRRTGWEVLPELRRVAPEASVIILSGFSTASVAEEAIDLGAVRFLTKGADPEAINDAIEAVFAETRTGMLTSQVSPS